MRTNRIARNSDAIGALHFESGISVIQSEQLVLQPLPYSSNPEIAKVKRQNLCESCADRTEGRPKLNSLEF
jgi:hypothetical protein